VPGAGGGPGDRRAGNGKTLRTAADLNGRLPEASWAEYLSDLAVKTRMLESLLGLGFALLREASCREGQVLEVAQAFGYVRETSYGRLFDVRVEPDPDNLAFTGARIPPHTGAVPLQRRAHRTGRRPAADRRGRPLCLREVRFNNRSIRTLLLPADELESFYRAYRTFTEITLRPELHLEVRLLPGYCLIFDNVRLLPVPPEYRSASSPSDGSRPPEQ